MLLNSRLLLCSLLAVLPSPFYGQDLSPRAYVITPMHFNAITLTWSFYDGGVNLNGTVPITGAMGRYNVPVFSYYHSLNFFGRSANFTLSLPYAVGNFSGEALGEHKSIYRSGLLDFSGRFSVNLMGGPTMQPQQFATWKQKVLLGASLKVLAPTGQYEPTKLINRGINRWAFKPEFGYSECWGNWLLDAYAGVWFYTTNSASYDIPMPKPQTGKPIGSFEGHISRNFAHGTWVSLDGNFWWGRVTTLNGTRHCYQTDGISRWGHRRMALFQTPVGKDQLQRWNIHPFRRQLPERVRGMAVLVACSSEVETAPLRMNC